MKPFNRVPRGPTVSVVGLRRVAVAIVAMAALQACSGAPISAEQRNATDLNPSGRPIQGPANYQPQSLSNSFNGVNPLYCKLIGPGTVCERTPTGSPNTPPSAGGA